MANKETSLHKTSCVICTKPTDNIVYIQSVKYVCVECVEKHSVTSLYPL